MEELKKQNNIIVDHLGNEHERFFDKDNEEIIRHDRSRGCTLVLKRQVKVTKRHFLKVFMCLSHGCETCRCGIPFGRHGEYVDVQKHKRHGEKKIEDISIQGG